MLSMKSWKLGKKTFDFYDQVNEEIAELRQEEQSSEPNNQNIAESTSNDSR
jgi:hypothetical protein